MAILIFRLDFVMSSRVFVVWVGLLGCTSMPALHFTCSAKSCKRPRVLRRSPSTASRAPAPSDSLRFHILLAVDLLSVRFQRHFVSIPQISSDSFHFESVSNTHLHLYVSCPTNNVPSEQKQKTCQSHACRDEFGQTKFPMRTIGMPNTMDAVILARIASNPFECV